MKVYKTIFKPVLLALCLAAPLMLTGCIGAPIAQQIVSSIAMRVADKVVADSIEAQEKKQEEESKKMVFADKPMDEFDVAFLTSNFGSSEQIAQNQSSPYQPTDYRRASYQPLNKANQAAATTQTALTPTTLAIQPMPLPANPNATVEASRLVRVEIWNAVIGDEKLALLQKAYGLGSEYLPAQNDWAKWQVAIGNLENDKSRTIHFLVSPEMGRIHSGEMALVEIAPVGGMHVARYVVKNGGVINHRPPNGFANIKPNEVKSATASLVSSR